MSDPDQEEIRRKRLARLGGPSASSSSQQGTPQQEVGQQNTDELSGPSKRSDSNSGSNCAEIPPTVSEDISMQTIEEGTESKIDDNYEAPVTTDNLSVVQGAGAVPSVHKSDSSTAMDVTFTPSSSPPKPLNTGKASTQQIESKCGQANNHSSTSQKSQSPIFTDFDSGIETMDIDNEPTVQSGNVINPNTESTQAASTENLVPSARSANSNKSEDIHNESNIGSTDHCPMEKDEQSQENADSGQLERIEDNKDCPTKNSPEKRKRTSSSANYEINDEQILGVIQNIFGCKILCTPSLTSANDDSKSELLYLPECSRLVAETRQELALKLTANPVQKEDMLNYSEVVSDILTEILIGMTKKIYPSKATKLGNKATHDIKEDMFRYLVQCYEDVGIEERNNKKKIALSSLAEAFSASRKGLIMYTCLVFSGTFETEAQGIDISISTPLFEPLLKQTLPSGFLVELINYATIEFGGKGREIFEPLLRCLVLEARSSSIVDLGNYRKAISALSELSEISIEKNRPICQLMTEMTEWLPEEIATGSGGRELPAVSLLGPLLALSIFAEEDPTGAEHYFSGPNKQNARTITSQIQQELEISRVSLHKLFHSILVNASSRNAALNYLSECMARNLKRQQLQVNERTVAGDGFMLNVLSVLQLLAAKVSLRKVDFLYLHSTHSRMNPIGDDTRLKMTKPEAEAWIESILKEGYDWKEPKFPTECWFLTLQAHHIAMLPCIRRYQRRLRALKELEKMISEMERTEPQWKGRPMANRNKQLLKKWKSQAKKLTKSKQCSDIGLLDRNLFQRCLQFYASVAEFLILAMVDTRNGRSLMDNDVNVAGNKFVTPSPMGGIDVHLPLPLETTPIFASLPEWIVDDIADFLLFALQYFPLVVVEHMDQNLMTFLLTALCSPTHFKNPYLVSKLVEVLFVINPSVQDRTDTLFMRVMSHPISEEHLPSSLMTFYTEVEQTGASSEFYDKFTIRYHISIIMKSMWESTVHKIAIINESKSGKQFVKFINMLMNDTTFLLGEFVYFIRKSVG